MSDPGFLKRIHDAGQDSANLTGPKTERAEDGIGSSEQLFRLLVDGVSDYAIFVLDPQGRVKTWNTGAERIKGYRADEIVGRHFSIFYTPEALERAWPQRELELAVRDGRFEDEGWRIRKDGSRFWANVLITPLRDAAGELLGFSKITRDLSERKRAEETIRAANLVLEDEVQRRTAQLEERNAELLRSNQELDDFAYIASHDLKEPLRGIHNYATFLIEDYRDLLDDAGRAKLETLQRLTQRMDALLDSLLDSSRVGRLELAIAEIDLAELVDEVVDSLRISLEQREVEVRVAGPLPALRCDRVRVGEVLRNLIANAMKYNDKPEKWIEIGAAHVAPPDADGRRAGQDEGLTAIYVRDNGIGIREKHFAAIFRIFKRLHARDHFGGGTGAGLTIAKKIVERHGGRIWVESEYGQGTTFFFTLAEAESQK
ncbi:MAG TPA: PAS domain S-box protein [Pirellulales bacterium]|nr:PAS domain S-box protein [Pirellulales bacterium]